MTRSLESYSGEEVQMDLLGKQVKPEARYDGHYKNFSEALKLAKEHQPDDWDLKDPPEPFANALHLVVQKKLDEALKSLPQNAGAAKFLKDAVLELFTAYGSHFDHDHGTDLFFILRDSKGRETEQTRIDATTNSFKWKHGGKSGVIIVYIPNGSKLISPKTEEDIKELEKQDFIPEIVDELIHKAESVTKTYAQKVA